MLLRRDSAEGEITVQLCTSRLITQSTHSAPEAVMTDDRAGVRLNIAQGLPQRRAISRTRRSLGKRPQEMQLRRWPRTKIIRDGEGESRRPSPIVEEADGGDLE